jgi:HEAT repeat protein
MDVTKALAFLERHQPLPPDDQLSAELIRNYDEVRKFFIEHPDSRCIPLFLNSFGGESCFGVYQLVEDVFRPFPPEAIVSHLKESLSSVHWPVRYWRAQIAMAFPAPELLEPLEKLLRAGDSDTRVFAACAIGRICEQRNAQAIEVLRSAYESETDIEVRKIMGEALSTVSEPQQLI